MTGGLHHSEGDPELLQRISHEYAELPGLRLTLAQACRLLATGRREAQVVLDELVDRQVLRRSGADYVRAES